VGAVLRGEHRGTRGRRGPAGLRRPGRLLLVFLAAFAARGAYLHLADQPLLYTHQYTYFSNALRIAEHPSPLHYVWTSDEWRTWDGHWTIAPLYHLFAAAVLFLFGPALAPLRWLQCFTDALAAVGVAVLARQAGARHWMAAGLGYALWWAAIETPSWTMTENLHTPLFVWAFVLLAREREAPSPRRALLAGALCGLASLARSVSTGFLGLASLHRAWSAWRALPSPRPWRAALPGVLVLAGGLAVILPWTARNALVIGDAVLIESAAFENLWFANHFTDPVRYKRQEEWIHSRATPAEKRVAAAHFALRGWRRDPERIVAKAWTMFWHFVRPEGLHGYFLVERPAAGWYHVGTLLLDDVPLLLVIPLFLAFAVGGRASPARPYILIWAGYYVLMVTVVFHNEVRYRSALMPFAMAGAAAGFDALFDPERRRRARAGLAVGAVISAASAAPYLPYVVDTVRTVFHRGDVTAAAGAAPRSARPWQDEGRALHFAGRPAEALKAYWTGQRLATAGNPRTALVLPRLMAATGDTAGATEALEKLHRSSWQTDPWVVLEDAWRELPPPRTDVIELGGDDYGAVRGFFHPRGLDPAMTRHVLEWNRYDDGGEQPPPGLHRWSRGHAWLRLLPRSTAASYDLALVMGTPFPAPIAGSEVAVRVGKASPVVVQVGRELKTYTLRVPAPQPGEPLAVELTTRTWVIRGEPAGQGVRVDRLTVTPVP
jgi:hypothetical protein